MGTPASADLWDVLDRHMEEVGEEIRLELISHPVFGPMAMQPDPEADRTTRALLRPALLEGKWDPYWEHVSMQAVGFANTGSGLSDWVDVIHSLRSKMLPHVFTALERDPHRLLAATQVLERWLDKALGVFADSFVAASETMVESEQAAIRQLSTPVLQVRPGLLIMPIIGELDVARSAQLRHQLLSAVRSTRARAVVIDVTGVPAIDSQVAANLLATAESGRLMGTETVFSGLSAALAQALVGIGLDVARLRSVGDLQSGIELAEKLLGR